MTCFTSSLISLLLLVLIPSTHTCGVSTHISIGQQAKNFVKSPKGSKVDYTSLLRKHKDAFTAGLPFPDGMYNPLCFFGHYHQVAEDTHWVKFLKTSIDYVRKTYPQPWNEDTEKLIAFIMGVVSHQVSDVAWHSLGIDQGFIRTMAALNFKGNYDKAHTTADFGGDMLALFNGAVQHHDANEWYVPVDDLYQIYKQYYQGKQHVPKLAIEVCSKLLFIEYTLEAKAGSLIFKPFAKKSPFLVNQLEDFFLGGLNDMASWTTLLIEDTSYMLEHGTDSCYLVDNPLYVQCVNLSSTNQIKAKMTSTNQINAMLRSHRRSFPLLEKHKWNMSFVTTERASRGVYFRPSDEMKEKMRRHRKTFKTAIFEQSSTPMAREINSKTPYEEMGKSLTTINIGGEAYLAVGSPNYGTPGAPQLGRVILINEKKLGILKDNKKSLEELSDFVITGESKRSRFGWSIASMKYNEDEFEDLVVTAPGHEGEDPLWNYEGKVYIFFGSKHSISLHPSTSLIHHQSTQFTNFGYHVTKCHDHMITIGSPFHSGQTGELRLIDTGEGEPYVFQMMGEETNGWFGYHSACRSTNDAKITLAISSPMYSFMDDQSTGFVDLSIGGEPITRLYGSSQFSEFGSCVSLGKGQEKEDIVVAISSPAKSVKGTLLGVSYTMHQAGEVQVYHINTTNGHTKTTLVATLQGDRAYGRFGDVVKFVDVDEDGVEELIVSAPLRSSDPTEALYGGNEGAVFVFDTTRFHGDVTRNCSGFLQNPCPGEKSYGRFGTALEVVKASDGRKRLVVSSRYSSKQAFRGGKISVHEFQTRRTE